MAVATKLDLHSASGHIYTPVVLNGIEANMVLDTGASATVVTEDLADRLKLSLRPAGAMSGVGGTIGTSEFFAKTFQIGTLHGAHLPLLVGRIRIPLGPVTADGLFGADFLAGYDIDLDLAAQQARLYKVVSGCSAPAAAMEPPLFYAPFARLSISADLRPIVHVQIAGHSLLALIDTGAWHSAIFRNAAHRLGLRPEDLADDAHDVARGVGPGAVRTVRHVVPPVAVGEVTLTNLPVEILDQRGDDGTDMLLGMDFLSRVHAWISFSSGTLIMQLLPKPAAASGT